MYLLKKNIVLGIFAFIFIINFVYSADMTLLAVSTDNSGNLIGSGAELFLNLQRGQGRLFMEAYSFTKLDTQMSTRFAKDIACDYLEKDCSNYDFFYTIKTNSAIIGGPSAGAALAFLTIAKLQNKNIPDDFSITGTINHGGLIGRVGGIEEKVKTAAKLGLKRMFIPKGERYYSEQPTFSMNVSDIGEVTNVIENQTQEKKDLVLMGQELGIEVIEVSTIRDLVCQILDDKDACLDDFEEVSVDSDYEKTMIDIGVNLCNRTNQLIDLIGDESLIYALKNNVINYSLDINIESLVDLMMKRRLAFEYERYYSMASFCFSSNLILQTYLKKDLNLNEIVNEKNKLQKNKNFFQEQIESKKINSITDLQSYIIVKERLYETQDYIDFIDEQLEENISVLNLSRSSLAYGIERFYSASLWAEFFGRDKNYLNIDEISLRDGCTKKTLEAQERLEYLNQYYPYLTENAKKAIEIAFKELEKGDYAYCLFKASKAKAQIDNMIGSFSVTQENVDDLLEDKKKITARLIKKQQEQGIFPILGFSYYEYALMLGESEKISDKASALLYYDYAIEFSNLDSYFDEKKENNFINTLFETIYLNLNVIVNMFVYSSIFLIGIILGFISKQTLSINVKPKKKTAKKKKIAKKKK